MKQKTLHNGSGLLLLGAAAAFPFAPLAAQVTDPSTQPPVVQVTPPPPVVEVITPDVSPAVEPAPAPAIAAPEVAVPEAVPEAAPAPRVRAERAPARLSSSSSATPPPPASDIPPAAAPAPLALAPIGQAAPLPTPVTAPPVVEPARTGTLLGSLLVGAALLLIVIGAFFALRRRRRTVDERYDSDLESDALARDSAPIVAAPAVAPIIEQPVEYLATRSAPEPRHDVPADAPDLEFNMRPLRAGVTGEDAHVEFELTLDNKGTAPAHDVRVSTWMFPAGATPQSDMERLLIGGKTVTRVAEIDAGELRQIDRAHTLSTLGMNDSVQPVVVAEARYRRDDGSEECRSASFAIGIPIDGDLAHFDLENPSGMHEDVEARALEDATSV